MHEIGSKFRASGCGKHVGKEAAACTKLARRMSCCGVVLASGQ